MSVRSSRANGLEARDDIAGAPLGVHPAEAVRGQRDAESWASWLQSARTAQRAAMLSGPTVVSCTAPYGVGGLGRHLAELGGALRACDSLCAVLTPQPGEGERVAGAVQVAVPALAHLALRVPPVRFSLSRRVEVGNRAFDQAAARRLPRDAEHLLVFAGHALAHASRARALGYRSIGLIAPTAHMTYVARQHEKAYRLHPIERPWALPLSSRYEREYEAVERIFVASRLSWESFATAGVDESRLRHFPLTPHERYAPSSRTKQASTFNVVYVGALAVHKGVPLLIEAVRRLRFDDLRLILVGGWGTRGMRRYIEQSTQRDARILVQPGDPLPQLNEADVLAHPSYQDGFAYAPAEALACGVPVIVTEDTGMKELVRDDVNGRVIPTGDLDALTCAIEAAYRGQLLRARSDGALRAADNQATGGADPRPTLHGATRGPEVDDPGGGKPWGESCRS